MIRIPDEQEQQHFCDELEKRPGVLARRYDCVHRERLTAAGHAIHAWLSALDGEYQPAVARMTLAEFATAYAESQGPGLRRFKSPKPDGGEAEIDGSGDPIIRKRHEDGTIELTNDVVLKPGKGGA
jgi:hypothetical protein